jgi:glycosyltransferase involved in cell wall biosynthesis
VNILHVTPYYAPAYAFGGVTRVVEGLARAQAAHGHAVTVLTTDALSQGARWQGPAETRADGVRVLRARNRSLWLRGHANLSTPQGFASLAERALEQAEIVHVHELRTVEALAVIPRAAARRLPVLLSPHGTLTRTTGRSLLKAGWDALFGRRLARGVSTIVALNAAEAEDAAALWAQFGLPAPDTALVPNGIDPAELVMEGGSAFRALYGLGEDVMCLFLGRLHPRKGVLALAQAFAQANVPGTRLVFAGADDGALAGLRPLLGERIIYAGFLQGAQRLAALDAADVFALPATGEGQSIAALEAMAVGLPLLLSPGCHLPEAQDAGAALIVPPQPEALAHALARLLTDSALRRQMSRAAAALALQRFTWERAAAQMEAVYRKRL